MFKRIAFTVLSWFISRFLDKTVKLQGYDFLFRLRVLRSTPTMLPIPSFLAPVSVCAAVLNQLLRREEWARERLSRHAGKSVRFVVGGTTVALTLQSSGFTQPCDAAIVPDVTLTIPASKLGDLPRVLRGNDQDEIAALLHVEGDAALAQVVSGLARELRWDFEDDLSRVVGDVAAVRLLKGARSLLDAARLSKDRLTGNVTEYLSEESGLLLARPPYEEWRSDLETIQVRLALLEQRVAQLQRKPGHRSANQA